MSLVVGLTKWENRVNMKIGILEASTKNEALNKWALDIRQSSMGPVWPEKNPQMSIKVAQKWFHKKKW